jgi:hypothetical protein
LSLRAQLPILAAVAFAILSFATTIQPHVIEVDSRTPSSNGAIGWGEGPTDIGTPADVLLLVLGFPALIALIPMSPLGYWFDFSEPVLRTAWGLAVVAQWLLIGRCFDVQRGLLPRSQPCGHSWRDKLLFGTAMVVGAPAAVAGLFGLLACTLDHLSIWSFVIYAGMALWGSAGVIGALRWRSSSAWAAGGSRLHPSLVALQSAP